MDPIHIRHLLRQLTKEVKCPHCGAKVQPHMVSIESSTQSFCLLKIACHSCGEEFHGHAHVGVKVPAHDDEGLENILEPERLLPATPLPITEEELTQISALLENTNCTTKDLFSAL